MTASAADHAAVIREACDKERARLVAGTPEKYPGTTVKVKLLDAEALLALLEAETRRADEALQPVAYTQDPAAQLMNANQHLQDRLEKAKLAADQWHQATVRVEALKMAALRERDSYREALGSVLTRCEDANAEWSRLDVAAIAREALAAGGEP